MSKNKKTVSLKLQYYLSLVPYFGVIIVWIIGIYNIYSIQKKRIYCLFYYLLSIVPIMLFGGIFIIVFLLFINLLDGFILRAVISYVLIFIVCVCMAISIVSIQKVMIERLEKKVEKQIENNLY